MQSAPAEIENVLIIQQPHQIWSVTTSYQDVSLPAKDALNQHPPVLPILELHQVVRILLVMELIAKEPIQ